MTEKRISVFLVSLLAAVGAVQIAAARVDTIGIGDLRQIRAVPAKPAKLDSAPTLKAAQAWLMSVGYDLSLEDIPKHKKLHLQMYGQGMMQKVTDDTLIHLRVMKGLEEVTLPRWIGDNGLAHLAGLTNLKILSVPISRVTDAGLDHLKDLSGLTSLSLSGDDITAAGIAKIKHLSALSFLGLDDAKITDAAIAVIAELKGLKSLSLNRTAVTDAAIPSLRLMTGLTRLDIQSAKISPAGFAQLQAALPNCTIHY